MNAHKVEVTLTQDSRLTLEGLPFQAGDAVEIIILERPRAASTTIHSSEYNPYPLRGKVIRYDAPFDPAVPDEDWDVMQ
jgi:hypothetical protein